MYEESAAELRADLQPVDKVAVALDFWTALTTESYVTITCHFIQDWDPNSAVPQTCSTDKRHTTEDIADHFKPAAEEWGVLGKVYACVHDSTSNIVVSNEHPCGNRSCASHTRSNLQ